MNMWEAIILIVLITSVARACGLRGRRARNDDTLAPPLPDPETEALRREVEELRQRVRVLERIVTDGHTSRDLADEIESLRHR